MQPYVRSQISNSFSDFCINAWKSVDAISEPQKTRRNMNGVVATTLV